MNSFRHLHQPTDRTIHIDQKDYFFFGGTAYLGLLVNEKYKSLVKEGIDLYGLNNGTSRSNNVQLGIYAEAENHLADRFDYESAALFSSGYLAAQATVKSLANKGNVYYAPHAHQALWMNEKPAVELDNFQDWIVNTVKDINDSSDKDIVIIANAMDNLKPEIYDFSLLRNIHQSINVILILDDSHGIGVVNKNGISAEISSLSSCSNISIVIVCSLAKGLGTDAGLVLGNKELINEVKKSPIFIGASPSSPAFIYALVNSVSIYDEAYDKLQRNINFFSSKLDATTTLSYVDRFPVFTSTDSNLYRYLCKNDILISSFPYPLPSSPLLNRIVITALHSEDDLHQLTDVLHLDV